MLLESAHQLGAELATPNQIIADAIGQLNVNLVVIGCDPNASASAVRGSWESYILRPNTQPFTRAVRAATNAIIWRPYRLQEPAAPTDFSNGALAIDSTEGAVWIDPASAAYRKRQAFQNGAVLRSVIQGLASKGYAEKRSKRDMHDEFDEVLDGLWTRGSYHCFPESRLVARTMDEAGLRNFGSTIHTAKRFRGFAKDFGLGLALERLLSE